MIGSPVCTEPKLTDAVGVVGMYEGMPKEAAFDVEMAQPGDRLARASAISTYVNELAIPLR